MQIHVALEFIPALVSGPVRIAAAILGSALVSIVLVIDESMSSTFIVDVFALAVVAAAGVTATMIPVVDSGTVILRWSDRLSQCQSSPPPPTLPMR